jgi:hypothetical protein
MPGLAFAVSQRTISDTALLSKNMAACHLGGMFPCPSNDRDTFPRYAPHSKKCDSLPTSCAARHRFYIATRSRCEPFFSRRTSSNAMMPRS